MNRQKSLPKFMIRLISGISLSGSILLSIAGSAQEIRSGSQTGQTTLEEKLNRLKEIDAHLIKLEKEEKRLHQLEREAKQRRDQEIIETLIQQEQYYEALEKQERKHQKKLRQRELKATKIQKKEEKAAQKKTQPRNEPSTHSAPIKLVDIETTFNRATDGEGQINQTAQSTVQFKLFNGDTLGLTSGYNSYAQEDIDTVKNIPIKIDWEKDIGNFTLSAKTSIDLYNRLDSVPGGSIGVKHTASPKWLKSLSTSAEIEYAPYKFNAQTIENDIRYLRIKGSIFADINKNTSFFTAAHAGILNDGNQEYQVFSRLERKLGKKFSVAGNLFAWGFADDLSLTSGYFSPSSFLVYNAELGWQEDITDFLNCRLSASLGQQHVEGDTSQTSSLKGSCKVSILDDIEFDVDYTYSNVSSGIDITGGSSFSNSIKSNLKFKY